MIKTEIVDGKFRVTRQKTEKEITEDQNASLLYTVAQQQMEITSLQSQNAELMLAVANIKAGGA